MGLLSKFFIGNNEVTAMDIKGLNARARLSSYLPYLKFRQYRNDIDSGEGVLVNEFINADATVGYCWEYNPIVFESEKQLNTIHNLIKSKYPEGTILQFILMTDNDHTAFMAAYKAEKNHGDEVAEKGIVETEKWINECATKGNPKMSGIPVRNHRAFFAVKSPKPLDFATIASINTTLRSLGTPSWRVDDVNLRSFLFKFINNRRPIEAKVNREKEIRKQIITADTPIKMVPGDKYAKIGERYAACLTPQTVPEVNDPLKTNGLFGGCMGIEDDNNQITVPYLYSLNIIVSNKKKEIDDKYGILQWQRVGSSLIHRLNSLIGEFDTAKSSMENKSLRYYSFIPTLWVFGNTKRECARGVSDVKNLWEKANFEMQQETKLKAPLFIASLPFGLYNIEDNIDNIDRHFIASTEDIARFAPVQGDFRGSDNPATVYFGRKGQLIGMNHFDKRVNAYNFAVFGVSGGGKTFALNDMMDSYASSGYKLRLTDIGYGFQKLAALKGGRFFDFQLGSDLCINPLDFDVTEMEPDDAEQSVSMAMTIIGLMVYSISGKRLDETEAKMILEAIGHVIDHGNQLAGPTAVQAFLYHYDKLGEMKAYSEYVTTARGMAYNMKRFCKGGPYESMFCGKSNFNIRDEQMVVVELDKVRSIPELFQIITLQMMNLITQDLYLGDRSVQTVILFEEVISFLSKNKQHDVSHYAAMIEEGYRRARKYRGSLGVVLQSVLDLAQLDQLGRVINSQAIFKYYLESSDFRSAVDQKLIPSISGGFGLDLLTSIKSNRPQYSEFFLDANSLGRGMCRLCVDQWRYEVNTSDGADFENYKTLIERGFTPVRAISELSGVKL